MPSPSPRELSAASRGAGLGAGGQALKLFTISKARTLTGCVVPCRRRAGTRPCAPAGQLGGLLSDAPALAPRCPRPGGPPARSRPTPVSPAPILHPTALLAQSPPSLPAWLGTVLFLASAAVIWHLNVTRSLVANIYSSKIFKFQGL